jgi:hypothetical protein
VASSPSCHNRVHLGEASAIEWFTRCGWTVWTPLGHSPDADLIVELNGRVLRVQVKTSTCREARRDGTPQWHVSLATNGGNQSWSGVAKVFDPSRFDVLFALVGDGRRWLIPADAVEGNRGLSLGGVKYSEFEIEAGGPIDHVVYGGVAPLDSGLTAGGVSKRSTDAACKAVGSCLRRFESCLPHDESPTTDRLAARGDATSFERKLGRSNQVIIRPKRQMTLPKRPFSEAGMRVGDRMRVRADGDGRILFERIDALVNALEAPTQRGPG